MSDPVDENKDEHLAPFSGDANVARAQLEEMRPGIKNYFQRYDVRQPHDEIRTDRTIELVWDQYQRGNEIRNRFAYAKQVARSQLSDYLENEGLEVELTDDPGVGGESPNPGTSIEDNLYLKKQYACVMECREKIGRSMKFTPDIVEAFFQYKLLEGHAKEDRDLIATSLGFSREKFDQVLQKVKRALIRCVKDCMNRPRAYMPAVSQL
jgi:hypothetical protein